jgi:glycosyltransferase involved in cell wall biosynthesis
VVVVVPGPGPVEDRARELGLDVLIVPQPESGVTGPAGFAAKLFSVFRLSRALRQQRARVAWIHSMVNPWQALAARLAGTLVLWHGHEPTVPGGRYAANLRRWLVRRLAHAVVFAGQSARRAWLGPRTTTDESVLPDGSPKTRPLDFGVLANPLDAATWSQLARREPTRPFPPGASDPVVILASGLYARKGADRLLRGVAAWGRCARIILIGEGRHSPEDRAFLADLERLIEDLPPGIEVHRPGPVSSVADYLAQAHVFASLSRSEVAPLLLIEAMASGVPVIVTDTGDQADMVGHGSRGLVVNDASDPLQVAAALQQVMEDWDGNMTQRCQKARAWAIGTHDPDGAADQARRILSQVLWC